MTGTIILASEGVGDSEDGWAPARQVRAIETLWPLLGRHIAFHRRLVDLTASVKAAVLLSQSIYWTRHGRDIDEAGAHVLTHVLSRLEGVPWRLPGPSRT